MNPTPTSGVRLLARLRRLAGRAREAHQRSSVEWIRRIEAPAVRSDLLD